jgi:hypothetical protein
MTLSGRFQMVLAAALAAAAGLALTPRAASATDPMPGTRFTLTGNPQGAAQLAKRLPSFSRQTHLACSACHYQFPQLTPFGRTFKLNGYTLSGLAEIVQKDSAERQTLKLSPISPVAAMVVVSQTHLNAAIPGTANPTTLFPDQLSLFYAGELTPKVGAFIQLTYSAPDGAIGLDNVDLRFADRTKFADKPLVYGISLENNPTVQDPWNTVPAWGFPFMSSPIAPSPIAAPVIDGALGQQVAGLGVYGFWNNLLYAEFTAYTRAPQGVAFPLDTSVTGVPTGFTPYWRVALQRQFGKDYLEVGTFGMQTALIPMGITGPSNKYTDIALDAQYEHKMGDGVLIGRATWIHESQRLNAAFDAEEADFVDNTLQSWKLNASYDPSLQLGMTLGAFGTTGTTDPALYAPGDVTGSAVGSPNSTGFIGEFDYNPWQNTRLSLQYTWYTKFNGGSSGYDGTTSRTATNNNTLYMFLWVAF